MVENWEGKKDEVAETTEEERTVTGVMPRRQNLTVFGAATLDRKQRRVSFSFKESDNNCYFFYTHHIPLYIIILYYPDCPLTSP